MPRIVSILSNSNKTRYAATIHFMSDKTNRESPLVAAVLALQNHLAELERLGSRINSTDMTSEVDSDHVQKLMKRFAECGQGVADEVKNLSVHLQQARARAEAIADGVARQAEAFNTRRNEQNTHLERFRVVGERVRELNAAISRSRLPDGDADGEERSLVSNLSGLEQQLTDLIVELQDLRDSARGSRMKDLEKDAGSLAQTLQALKSKLRNLQN